MLRRLLLSTLLLGLAAPAATAQEAPDPTRIYIATFNIRLGDIPAWSELYYTQAVPILEGLVGEGAINGFNIRMHHTGGEYTIRQGLIGTAATDYDGFWGEYLSRYAAAHPRDFERVNRMILAHEDEIWNLDVLDLGDGGGQAQYLYEAKFQVNFADLGRWSAMWAADVLPTLDALIAEGLIQGYVIQSHNTGGKYNWKIAWLFDEWDNLDEAEASMFEAVPLDHAIWSMFSAHRDELWQSLPGPGN